MRQSPSRVLVLDCPSPTQRGVLSDAGSNFTCRWDCGAVEPRMCTSFCMICDPIQSARSHDV